ncbi:DivIVA domain-containing protein [Nesterenkonia sp. MY13]|uniref:DivIVA domain-containing protein n=1 Tax=Nesterenkonia sedimenti TaxID=1463632 RepID=A0A7X8TJ60_9MICC|nr:DivIVA domain-containing protein [Nesterenkonia sedimenti]NLS09544.1 DivIVA domain-containing protein [Nesterenkonia sedimenti]
MLWLNILALLIIAVVVVLLLGKWNGEPAPREDTPENLSSVDQLLERTHGVLSADDLENVELDPAVRGYRMDQVDKLLDALAQQLREPDQGTSADSTDVNRPDP